MDGSGSLALPALDALGTGVPSQLSAPDIASEMKGFGRRMESLLATLERSGSCESHKMMIARALLHSLLDAIDEMGQVSRRA